MSDQEKKAAEAAAQWLQSQIDQHGEDIILEMITDRSMLDLNKDDHGLLGCINFLLGWGRWRVAVDVDFDEDWDVEHISAINVVEYPDSQPFSFVKELWHPIETAPKDGDMIIVATEGVPDSQYLARWRGGRPGDFPGTQTGTLEWRDNSGRFAHPTHWQALPDVPFVGDE